MIPTRRTLRPRRFTILDALYLVGALALAFGGVGAAGRSGRGLGAGMVFAGAAVAAHALIWLLFVVSGTAATARSRWAAVGLSAFYGLAGLAFLLQFALLVLIDPYNGMLVGGSVLAMLFYWVSWS